MLQDVRQRLTNRAAQLEEIHKANKVLAEWLLDLETKVTADDSLLFADLSEKRANLEKHRAILRDITSHSELVLKCSIYYTCSCAFSYYNVFN